MTNFFPRQTVAWKLEEPAAFRRLTLSLLEMAVLTGIVLRLYRAFVLTHGDGGSWLYLGATFAIGAFFLLGMLTLHLGNYTLRQWLWRAPAFGMVEAAAEMTTSLALIALHREPFGSARAELRDWPAMLNDTVRMRVIAVLAFGLLLAGVVQVVRYALLRRERRDQTAAVIAEGYDRRPTAGIPLPPK